MSDDGTWTVEPRPVPVELEHGFDHATFPPKRVEWATFEDQLSAADKQTMHLLMNGGAGAL